MKTRQQDLTENLKQKKNQQLESGGPDQPEHQTPTDLLESLKARAVMESEACNQRGKQSWQPWLG